MNRQRSRESDEENVPSGSDSLTGSNEEFGDFEAEILADEPPSEAQTADLDSESVEDSQKTSTEPSDKEIESFGSETLSLPSETGEKREEETMMRHRDFIIQMTLLGEQHSNVSYYSQQAQTSTKSKTPDNSQKNNTNTTAFRHPRSKFRMGGGIGGGMGGGIGGGIGGGMGGRMCGDGDSFHEPPPGLARPANQNRTFYY